MRADGSTCNPGQICVAGACAAKCFIGGTAYAADAANPADGCQKCAPATSTSAWSPRGTFALLTGGVDLASQGWTTSAIAPSSVTYGADYVRLETTTNGGAATSGALLAVRANAVPTTGAFTVRATIQVESVSTHNTFDSAAAFLGRYSTGFGDGTDRAQMIYLDSAAIGWSDDTQSAAVAVTNGSYHVYELAVDATQAATVKVDGVIKLTRNGFTTNGTIAIGDQTNDANVDGVVRIKSVERVCP